MDISLAEWVGRICAGDRRAVAQAITLVERKDPSSSALLGELFHRAGKAYVIGITGSPGAGKSTLLEKIAVWYRQEGKRVGIIAVDPSSPFTGGAILGDRIRMQALATDEGTYIRSMATRGQLGGLAPAARDVALILDAAGCDVVLVETVGVGQDEVEVARLADATVVLLVPGMGDDVQTFKAGVMEIADLFVINKSDQPGAERVEKELKALLSMASQQGGWRPAIVKTTATSGAGVPEVCGHLENFRAVAVQGAAGLKRRRENTRLHLLELLRQSLFEKVARQQIDQEKISDYVEAILARRRDPHSVVEEVMEASGIGSGNAEGIRSTKDATMRIHHLGVAVESLETAVAAFELLLGRPPDSTEEVEDQKVRVAVFRLGESRIELLEASSPDSPVAGFISKRGPGVHHLTLAVENLQGKLDDLEQSGVRLIDRSPRVGAGGEAIAFLHPSGTAGVLVELLQESGYSRQGGGRGEDGR